jgi:rhodanese-related sulfurtransferase
MKDITPKQLKSRLDAGEAIDIIDVREDWEVAQGMLANAIHIPMDNIPDAVDQISREKPVVVMCHTGRRSEQVALWMDTEGFDNVLNLVGGIDQWSREIDPSLPRY